jgi:NADPH-dependent 2,4-dienoyl-CoA reductase/sulfur reductase-like enzyme
VKHIAIVGGSLAGLSAARALRSQGFDGRLTMIAGERHPPYDRPPLSKGFLAGALDEAGLALEAEGEDLAADWRLGSIAAGLRPAERAVELADGSILFADAVILATGAIPRQPWSAPPAGVHVLRTLDDARRLREDLRTGSELVVVGAGFIGAEVAATASTLGLRVTVVEAAAAPLAGPLGEEMGAAVAALHSRHGVRLLTGVGVTGFAGGSAISGVHLADGRELPADVAVIGVGVRPNTDWLSGSGLDVSNGVRCDAFGSTNLPAVFAHGDCATWFDPQLGKHSRLEHWTAARERAGVVVACLLSGGTDRRRCRPPYFWSDQYGMTIQVAGHTAGATSVTVEEGSRLDGEFLAIYRQREVPVAVLAIGYAQSFMRWRKKLGANLAPVPITAG